MTEPVSLNLRHGTCRHDCAVTWHGDYGPNRLKPGTHGSRGDVRRCAHGVLWVYEATRENAYFCRMDVWRPISRWWEPMLYRRARRAVLETPA